MGDQGTTRSRWAAFLLVAAVVLDQRPAVVAVAPLLADLRTDTPLMAGLLTTLPVPAAV